MPTWLTIGCGWCRVGEGKQCVTRTGRPTDPHAFRINRAHIVDNVMARCVVNGAKWGKR